MAQGPVVDVVFELQAERDSARLHTGDEMVSVSRSDLNGKPCYHVLGEVIFHESTGDNVGRVSKSRP